MMASDNRDYQFELPPRPDQLEAIGMVAVEWSYLESVVDAAIGTLAFIEDPDALDAMTAHVPFNIRFNMLATLFNLRLEQGWLADPATRERVNRPPLPEFGDTKATIQRLYGQRNALVHARWVTGSQGSPLTYMVQARGRLTRTRQGVPAQEIRRVAEEIAAQSVVLREVFDVMEAEDGEKA